MSNETDVRKASEQFYAALNRMLAGDAGPMSDIWSHSAGVTTMHPIGGRQTGWDAVPGSWEQVAKLASGGTVTLHDQIVQVAGDMAYEVGVERGNLTLAGHDVANIDDRVTNVYRRESAGWRIVHHHSDISQAMADILAKLQGWW